MGRKSGDKLGERIQAAQNWFTFFSRSGTPIGGSGSEVFAQYKEKCNHYPQTEKQKQDKAGQAMRMRQGIVLGMCLIVLHS